MNHRPYVATALATLFAGVSTNCSGVDAVTPVRIGNAFISTPVAQFREPWAMVFLPDGRLLVTEKKGALKLVDVGNGNAGDVAGVPKIAYGGQGGFGDVILHPRFAENRIVYMSYSEPGDGARAARPWRARSWRSTATVAASSKISP